MHLKSSFVCNIDLAHSRGYETINIIGEAENQSFSTTPLSEHDIG